MAKRIPNLWKMKLEADDRDPETLYSLYLCSLMLKDRCQRVVEVSPIIRRFASQGPGSKEGLCTFLMEREALYSLGKMDVALKRARLRDRIKYGKPVNYASHQWDESDPAEHYQLIYTLAPLHYYNGFYDLGCHLLETGLGFWFQQSREISYNLLSEIAPVYRKSKFFYPVSLAIFYHKLGKDLRDWKHWNAFIDGFPEKFFTVLKIGKEELRNDSKLLPKVISRIGEIQRKNRPYYTSGGGGQSMEDLIESPSQIKRRHDKLLKEHHESKEEKKERAETRRKLDQRLAELFPELRD